MREGLNETIVRYNEDTRSGRSITEAWDDVQEQVCVHVCTYPCVHVCTYPWVRVCTYPWVPCTTGTLTVACPHSMVVVVCRVTFRGVDLLSVNGHFNPSTTRVHFDVSCKYSENAIVA